MWDGKKATEKQTVLRVQPRQQWSLSTCKPQTKMLATCPCFLRFRPHPSIRGRQEYLTSHASTPTIGELLIQYTYSQATVVVASFYDTPTRHGVTQVKDKDEKTLTYTQFIAALDVVAVTLFPEVSQKFSFHRGDKLLCMQPSRIGDTFHEETKYT